MTIRVEAGDCLEVIPRLVAEGGVVDAVVTDPPYHLTSTLARFGKININDETKTSQRLRQKLDGAARLAHGFMNQQWDGGDVAFRPETWATVATMLRPGGFLLAFGGTRTFHRLVCAIEDAGFVIQDTIMWLYGSGFPKRRDMLKPAFEPICVAYKPGGKRTLQVDECRIGTDAGWSYPHGRGGCGCHSESLSSNIHQPMKAQAGRWPANVCHSGDAEVMEAFAAFGDLHARGNKGPSIARGSLPEDIVYNGGWKPRDCGNRFLSDPGSAARFFYCAKAGADDRFGSRHPTVKPVELLKWLVPLVTPKGGGTVLDCFAGSGTTGVAALATGRNAILIEREDAYIADIRERLAHYEGEGRHSLAARNRNAKPQEALPLFAEVAAE